MKSDLIPYSVNDLVILAKEYSHKKGQLESAQNEVLRCQKLLNAALEAEELAKEHATEYEQKLVAMMKEIVG